MDGPLTIIVVSLIFSAFFSATEISFLSANRLHIAIQKEKKKLSGIIISRFLDASSYFIATTLIGNTVALVIYGVYMAEAQEPYLEELAVSLFPNMGDNGLGLIVTVAQTISSTILVLFAAEFIPKSVSLINPDAFLQIAAYPMRVLYWVMYPVVWSVVNLSKFLIRRLFGVEQLTYKPVFGLSDLNNYVINTQNHPTENNNDINKQIFSNALEFKTIKVRDCQVPRKEIVAVNIEDSIEELKHAFVSSGHSKIPVFKESIDNIAGYCHLFHLFRKPEDIRSIMTDIIIVPETMLVNELMIKFINEHKSLALVVDEFGGTSGIVTIEDIMEEIFGEIEDEYDDEDLPIRQLQENVYEMSARHEVDFLNEMYGFNIPEGDYDTLGGFILHIKEDIPKVKDIVTYQNYRFDIKSVVGARIDLVQVTITDHQNKD